MSFVPYNLIDDPASHKAEHSDELQIEQAFKLFEQALLLHKAKQFNNCYSVYESLFKLDVISNHYTEEPDYIRGLQNGGANTLIDELNFLAPNLKNLRYLIFRNRALFYLDLLREAVDVSILKIIDVKPKDDVTEEELQVAATERASETFYNMLDDMGIALIYQEADEILLKTLYEILVYMRSDKLVRYLLEYSISSTKESDDLEGLIPINKKVLAARTNLLKKLSYDLDYKSDVFLEYSKEIDAEYVFLDKFRSEYFAQKNHVLSPRIVTSAIVSRNDKLNWQDVTSSIIETIRSKEDKSKTESTSRQKLRDLDPYFLTSEAIDILNFVVPDTDKEDDAVIVEVRDAGGLIREDTDDIVLSRDQTPLEFTPIEEAGDSAIDPEAKPDAKPEAKPEADDEVSTPLESPVPSQDLSKPPTKSIQRASKRLQKTELEYSWLPDIELTVEMFVETDTFIKRLNKFFEESTAGALANIPQKFVNGGDNEMFENDFIDILDTFSSKYLPNITATSRMIEGAAIGEEGASEKLRLLDILKSFSSSNESVVEHSSCSPLSEDDCTEGIDDLILKVNANATHINQVKIHILRHLMTANAEGICLISDRIWPERLLADVKMWLIQLDDQLIQESKDLIYNNSSDVIKQEVSFVTSVLELLSDIYISHKNKIDSLISQNLGKGFQKSFKASLNTQISSATKLKGIINRWKAHVEDIFYTFNDIYKEEDLVFKYYIRYKWTLINLYKADNGDFQLSKFITNQISQLQSIVQSRPSFLLNLHTPNYECISDINPNSISLLSDTIVVLATFARILYAKEDGNNDEATYILERTLVEPKYFDDAKPLYVTIDSGSIDAVKSLLVLSSIAMKLDLWLILFMYYSKISDVTKFQFGIERMLQAILEDFQSPLYTKLDETSRHNSLLKALVLIDSFISMFLDLLRKNSWNLSNAPGLRLEEAFKNLLKFGGLFYTFSLHEEASLITSKKTSISEKSKSTFERLKAAIAKFASAIVLYYDAITLQKHNPDKTLLLLSYIHEQLGYRRLCDAASGIFLEICQALLLKKDHSKHQNDILQVLACRNHRSITSNGFTPVDHGTVNATPLDLKSATDISKLVLSLSVSKDPLKNPPKGDLKLIIDEIGEIVGDTEYDPQSTSGKNKKLFDQFLEKTEITPLVIKNSFYGLCTLDLLPPNDSKKEIIMDGLYYLQGLLLMASYKSRKKSMQGRSLELENVIKLLSSDLLYCPDRVESWLLLGQAHSYLVEDDLIWTPDKLVVPERKVTTANLQRKALLCYLMGINSIKNTKLKETHHVVAELMSSFSVEATNACLLPMDMLAFKVIDYPFFLLVDQTNEFVNSRPTTVLLKKMCLKVIRQALHLAIKARPTEWINYYYLAKAQRKLMLPDTMVVETLLDSCNMALQYGVSVEPIIEPHYKLCSVIYKSVKKDKMAISEAIQSLHKHSIFLSIDGLEIADSVESFDKLKFFQLIVQCLKKLSQIDKKKWHHKYRYRLAKLYFEDLNDTKEAIEEMSSIVSLKATSKTLILIWKPDVERPGKHFCYTFDYIMFFIDLLFADKNLIGLLQMVPRLRRSTALMVNLNAAWEKLCNTICKLCRQILDIKENFTESFLNTPLSLFLATTKKILEEIKGNRIPEKVIPQLVLLNGINDMKKLNNGFGPTSLVDDTTVAIFINIYYGISGQLDQNDFLPTESPSARPKRLAKKDIYPFVNDITRISKRDVDSHIKANPELLNEFASKNGHNKNISSTNSVGATPAVLPAQEIIPSTTVIPIQEEATAPVVPAQGSGPKAPSPDIIDLVSSDDVSGIEVNNVDEKDKKRSQDDEDAGEDPKKIKLE